MYIPFPLSDLSGLPVQHHRVSTFGDPNRAVGMTSDTSASFSKKRKRPLQTLDLQSSLSSQSDPSSTWPLPSPTLLSSSPISNLQFLSTHQNQHIPSLLSTPTTENTPTKRRRLPLPPKARFRNPSTPTISSTTSTLQPPNLAPCHICHRRPTAHADLPGYSSCESCERRTCYVCMRVCEGDGCHSSSSLNTIAVAENEYDYYQSQHQNQNPGGWEFSHASEHVHTNQRAARAKDFGTKGKSICGKCCVEVGAEGKVWCLVCFEDDADENGYGGGESDDEEGDETGRVEEWLNRCDDHAVE